MSNFWNKLNKPILVLAPMAGITDSAFRQMCRKFGADVVYTEMVSADGLFYDSKKTLELLKFNKKEKPAVIQIFGKDPDRFTKAAQVCERAGFSGIDINFGCPAKKVAGRGGGVTLMRDLPKCKKIIEATLLGTKLPVSVKLRVSIKKGEKTITAIDFLKYMKDLDISAVMIHGRTYEQLFSGDVDYSMIKKVREEFKGVLLANGGINTPQDAKKMLDKTGADGIGLARGIYGKPWLFSEVREYLKKGKFKELKTQEIKKNILDHARLAFKNKDEHGIIEMRKHLIWYVSGWSQAKKMRSELVRVGSVKDIKQVLEKY